MDDGEPFPPRVVLVGFMGCGKSTIGPRVARLLDYGFLDMDEAIEERTGLSVAEIFRQRGEAAFREEERRLAADIARRDRLVVAAGGGAFAQPATRAALQERSLAVWLRCELATLLARIPDDGTRPLARSRETIGLLFAEREPSYRLAEVTVDASEALPDEVAQRVVAALRGYRRRTMER